MARINTYGQDTTLAGDDRVIGTDGSTGDTMNFSLSSLILFNQENLGVGLPTEDPGIAGQLYAGSDGILRVSQ